MNKLAMFFLLALTVSSVNCQSKKAPLSQKECTRIYLDTLSRKWKDIKFALGDDEGTIVSEKGDLELKHYTDNAYLEYKNSPDSLGPILSRYATASEDLYVEKKWDVRAIVPVIKPLAFLRSIETETDDSSNNGYVCQSYNEDLVICYAADNKNSIQYLLKEESDSLHISIDSLHHLALANLKERLGENVEIHGSEGYYMVTAGVDYEASMILFDELWTKENFTVKGDLIMAIPNRDLLLVTGTKNTGALKKINAVVKESHQNPYPVSSHLYRWDGKRFINWR